MAWRVAALAAMAAAVALAAWVTGRPPAKPPAGRTSRAAWSAPAPGPRCAISPEEPLVLEPYGSDRLADAGVLWGLVHAVDLGRGELHIRSGSELVTLHGSPDQLLELRPGDQGEFRFASYGDEPWLAPTSSPRRPLRVPAAMRGRASGMLSRVDGARGMAWLVAQSGAERVLRAHPERLRALMPGLWVTVAYSRVAGADWMATVEVRSAARARP